MKYFLIFSLFISLMGCNSMQSQPKALETDHTQVAAPEKPFFVDVRSPAEFAGGSVKDAINIPIGEVNNRLNELKGKKHIVVFCASGGRSRQAKSILEKNGFKQVTDGISVQNTQKIFGL